MTLFDRSKWAEDAGKAVRTAITISAIALAGTFMTGAWDNLVALWNLPTSNEARFKKIDSQFTHVRNDIEALRRPKEIFELAASSAAHDGYCIAGTPCTFDLVVRRTPEGVDCKIVVGATEYLFQDPKTHEKRKVMRVNPITEQNIGLDWTDVKIVVNTPPIGFTGDKLFFFIPFYTECNGPQDSVVVSQESRPLAVSIKPEGYKP